jgi:hypothetical protein
MCYFVVNIAFWSIPMSVVNGKSQSSRVGSNWGSEEDYRDILG